MSLFEDGFEEPEVNFPEKVIHESLRDFEKATHGLASLSISEIEDFAKIASGLGSTFQFEIILFSKFLQGYSFEIMKFGYDVSIYPVSVILQSEIGEELGVNVQSYANGKFSCPDEQNLLKVINAVVRSSKFKKTVGGLMKIARSKGQST